MTLEDLLARLDGVRRSGRGWMARCPAHDDTRPSLTVNEGHSGLLLTCQSRRCSIEAITAALGLSVADIFYDSDLPPHTRRIAKLAPRPRPFDWRRFADELQDEALDHWLRGTAILEAARGLNISAWTDGDIDEALEAVACAHADLARADALDRLAINIRAGGLRKERDRGPQSRRTAA